MTRTEEEKVTLERMLAIYCRGRHHASARLCRECSALRSYAFARLDRCRFGQDKPTCKVCPIHCYRPDMRERMREVMRYAGPRMLLHHPAAALKHLLRECLGARRQPGKRTEQSSTHR